MLRPQQFYRFFRRAAQLLRLSFVLVFDRTHAGPIRLRLFFEHLGGAFLKLGQILSLRLDLLPAAYASELLNLLSRVPARPFEELRLVFRQAVGADPETVFKHFDPEPVASASLAQVYRAQLLSGEMVAVKIKRPGTDSLFETDLFLAQGLAFILGWFSFFRDFKIREVVRDFVVWTRQELDFALEARQAEKFKQFLIACPQNVVPKVYLSWCTREVMVSEFLENIFSIDEVIRQLDRDPNYREVLRTREELDLEEISYRFVVDLMRQYLIDGFFHADPHPANVFLLSHNRLGYFDFGLMGEAGEERLPLLNIIYGIANEDLTFSSRHFLSFTKSAFRAEAELFKDREPETYNRYGKIMEKIEEIIVDNLRLDLEQVLASWYNANLEGSSSSSSSSVFSQVARRAGNSVMLPRAAAAFFRTIAIVDMVALRLNPRFVMLKAFRRFFEEYPIYRAEELIKNSLLVLPPDPAIDPLSHLSFEQFLELKERESERLLVAKERLADLVMNYAEKYEEIRKLLR
ncbi:MAG: AarF/UbiB family protein [Patescibacteria group bacterium]|mgnify:CR=1 FL=1